MSNKMEPLAVSPPEAARLLGISKSKIYTLTNQSDFPSFKLGGRTLVSVEGLRNWIAKQAEQEASA